MAYNPLYFSVNGMMILFLAYKIGFKSKYIYSMATGKYLSVCLWLIDVGLHIFIVVFMT